MPEFHFIRDEILTVSEFYTPEECRETIARAEAVGFADAPINTARGPILRQDIRNNTRVMIDDLSLAESLWQRLRDFVPLRLEGWEAVGLNERFRFYRYEIGQQFDWHRDGHFQRSIGERSRLTFMIYLNDDFSGGETSFEDVSIAPQTGQALVFYHPLIHKGQPVTSGRKYVLRSDVMYRQAVR